MELLPQITKEDREFLHYNPNTSDIIEWVQNYALMTVAIEREACARVCEREGVGHRDGFGQHCAAMIRSQTLITKGANHEQIQNPVPPAPPQCTA